MEWLNYHHLLYFWTVAKEGGISSAANRLRLSQSTVSAQIQSLERALGEDLFDRAGRRLVLTEVGTVVYRYAEQIFSLGKELQEVLKGRPAGKPMTLSVGIADVLPKLVAHQLLAPVLALPTPIRLVCVEDRPNRLIAKLAVFELDIVLSDGPADPAIPVKSLSRPLGECGTCFFGTGALAARLRDGFPDSLDDAPVLLPTSNTMLRRALDHFFETRGIRPKVVGEFEDSALLKAFGQGGHGIFPAPSIISDEVIRQYNAEIVGQLDELTQTFYAISVEGRFKHPGVAALAKNAWTKIFPR